MEHPRIFLPEGQEPASARWHSESGAAAPKRVVIADDTMTADAAYRLAAEGVGLLWRSDFQNARQLLQALMRRVDQAAQARTQAGRSRTPRPARPFIGTARPRRSARIRCRMLLIPFDADYTIPLRRAPDVRAGLQRGLGPGGLSPTWLRCANCWA